MGKSCRKFPGPFLILVNNPKLQQIFKKITYFEKALPKNLKKVNFIFSFESSYF